MNRLDYVAAALRCVHLTDDALSLRVVPAIGLTIQKFLIELIACCLGQGMPKCV